MKTSQHAALLVSLGLIGQALGQNGGMPANPFAPGGSGGGGQGGGMPSNPFGNNGAGQGGGMPQNPLNNNGAGQGGGMPQNPFNTGGAGGGATGAGTCPCPTPAEIPVLRDQPGCPATRASEPTSPADLTINPNLICPRDEGHLYQTPDGATFMIQCCAHGGGQQIGSSTVESDFRACMRKCSITDDCHSVLYTAQDKQNEAVGLCALYKEGGFSNAQCGAHDQHSYAFVVTPPPVAPEEEEPLGVKCLAECPYGDGQLFRTESGETFQLTCGKRAGTDYIHSDYQDSMMECMGACGRLMQCASADYDIHRKICYYTSGKPKPAIQAKSFASARSMGCGGVCGAKPENQCCA